MGEVYVLGSTIYAATGTGLKISTNGGGSWTTYTTTNGLANNALTSLYVTPGAIYAGTNAGLSISYPLLFVQ